MSNNIKFIKFSFWGSIIFLILSCIFYSVDFKCKFITSEFVYVIMSGVFASFFVLLLTESKNYFDNKRRAEDTLYAVLLELYIEFSTVSGNAGMFLKKKNEIVPESLFDMRAPIISNLGMAMRNIDYNPIVKNVLYNNIIIFKQNEVSMIDKHIILYNYLHQAVNITKIEALKKNIMTYNPISSDELVEIALKKINSDAEVRKKAVEGLINTLISQYPNRYNWQNDKKVVDSMRFDVNDMVKQREEFFES